MSSVNKVILVGALGRDPEVKSLPSGDRFASFSVATSEKWTDKQSGERKEKTEWHTVVVFNDAIVKVAENYLRKGSRVYIEGQLQTRKWQDQNGADRYSTEVVLRQYRGEIVMLGDPKGEAREASPPSPSQREQRHAAYKGDPSDEIPF